MNITNKQCFAGYEFYVLTALTNEQRHRGLIFVIKRGDTNELLAQAITIETPSTFKSVQTAEIEASAYAHELILSNAISTILGPSPSSSCKADVPKKEHEVRNLACPSMV